MLRQFFPKCPAGLNKQAPIDRLVRHPFRLIFRMHLFQPTGDLLGRPIPLKLTRYCLSQLRIAGQFTSLRAPRARKGFFIGQCCTVAIIAAIATNFSAHRRGSDPPPLNWSTLL